MSTSPLRQLLSGATGRELTELLTPPIADSSPAAAPGNSVRQFWNEHFSVKAANTPIVNRCPLASTPPFRNDVRLAHTPVERGFRDAVREFTLSSCEESSLTPRRRPLNDDPVLAPCSKSKGTLSLSRHESSYSSDSEATETGIDRAYRNAPISRRNWAPEVLPCAELGKEGELGSSDSENGSDLHESLPFIERHSLLEQSTDSDVMFSSSMDSVPAYESAILAKEIDDLPSDASDVSSSGDVKYRTLREDADAFLAYIDELIAP